MQDTATSGYQSPFTQPIFSVGTIDVGGILTIIFFLVFVAWTIYSVIAAYHWFRYSHRSWVAIPAMGVHLGVSAIFILLMASGV